MRLPDTVSRVTPAHPLRLRTSPKTCHVLVRARCQRHLCMHGRAHPQPESLASPQSRSRPWLACPRPRQTGQRLVARAPGPPDGSVGRVGTAERVASWPAIFSRPRSRDSSFSSFSQLAHASQFPCTSSPRSPTMDRRRSLLEPIAARLLSSDWPDPALPLARTVIIYPYHFSIFLLLFERARLLAEQFQIATLVYGSGFSCGCECECTCT
ncbi:hypothetical protein C8Q74DRAFT_410790 [Fomes fomentarius]|nr:hypothetical protein C8Q74DRAFT_410790 [Fomes fomentarius]